MSHTTVEEKPVVSSGAAWAVGILLAAFIVMTVNFVKIMGNASHGHEAASHHEEVKAPAHH